MLRLAQTFIDIALWRKGPQDLPASTLLALMVLATYMVLEFIGVRQFDLSLRASAIFIGVDVLMICGWLWLVLSFFGHRQRFIQTITATLGVGVMILLLDIAIRMLQLGLGLGNDLVDDWLLLRFLLIALLMGRIFMHALERGLMTGMALTVAIIYSTEAVVQIMLDTI